MKTLRNYYSTGALLSEWTVNEKGQRDGIYREFYMSGGVSCSTSYKTDIRHGPRIKYFEDGKVREELNYKNGRMCGKFTTYYVGGCLGTIGYLEDNGTLGEYIFISTEGVLLQHHLYLGSMDSKTYVPISTYIEDVYNITPEEEVMLILNFGSCILDPKERSDVYRKFIRSASPQPTR